MLRLGNEQMSQAKTAHVRMRLRYPKDSHAL